MRADVHVIDAGAGASALLASAVMAIAAGEGTPVVAVGSTAGLGMLACGGLRVDAWCSPPCSIMRLAVRPVARAVRAACSGAEPDALTCWSADTTRASALSACVGRAMPGSAVRLGVVGDALVALERDAPLGRGVGNDPIFAADARRDARSAIGAGESSLVVVGAADAPLRANAVRMLDVAGRAMLAGADVHLVLPDCMPDMSRTRRYARGLGLEPRLHIVDDAARPMPWWGAADAVLVTEASPLVCAVARAMGTPAVSAPGHAGDEATPERRAASASARDAAAVALVAMARARPQPARNASAASA
jgi:hypothetical protein